MKFCTLMSGSAGNALYVETTQTKIMIDAGASGKALEQALELACGRSLQELDALFISHEHRDHTLGAGVLARRYHLPVYATAGTWSEMGAQVGVIKEEQRHYCSQCGILELGDLSIEFFPVSHDAQEPVGFLIRQGQKTLGVATDSGVFTSCMIKALHNTDALVLEANHDPELLEKGCYPRFLKRRIAGEKGHLSNQGAALALLQILEDKTRYVVLSHLSEENNNPTLALQTVEKTLEENNFSLKAVEISVAPRRCPSPLIHI